MRVPCVLLSVWRQVWRTWRHAHSRKSVGNSAWRMHDGHVHIKPFTTKSKLQETNEVRLRVPVQVKVTE